MENRRIQTQKQDNQTGIEGIWMAGRTRRNLREAKQGVQMPCSSCLHITESNVRDNRGRTARICMRPKRWIQYHDRSPGTISWHMITLLFTIHLVAGSVSAPIQFVPSQNFTSIGSCFTKEDISRSEESVCPGLLTD